MACVTDISPVIAKGVLCLKRNLSCPVCHRLIMKGFDCKYTKWNVTCHGKMSHVKFRMRNNKEKRKCCNELDKPQSAHKQKVDFGLFICFTSV